MTQLIQKTCSTQGLFALISKGQMVLLGGLFLATSATAWAQTNSLREAEIRTCQAHEIVTWPDGHDQPIVNKSLRLYYRHAGAPPLFDEATVVSIIQRAAHAWSACGIPLQIESDSSALINPASLIVLQWNESQAAGNFALANVTQKTLSLSADMFILLAQRNPNHPKLQTLQMVVSHELGHFLGLMAHSRRCVDVMSYYDNGKGQTCMTRHGGSHKGISGITEYRSILPTVCDIKRCVALNQR